MYWTNKNFHYAYVLLIKIHTPSTPPSCCYFSIFLHSERASARGIDESIGGKTKEELNNNLRLFYASRSTLLGFRNGRFLNNPPFKKGIHIATDPAFQQSTQILDAKLKNMKQQREESVKHKPCIENEDLRRLKESPVMNPSRPQGLLNNVWFNVTLYFCRRETWRAKEPEEKQLCFSPRRKRKALRDNGARRGK